MTQQPYSERIANLLAIVGPVNDFFVNSTWAQRVDDPDICDFVLGNPHEMPLEGVTEALQRWSEPQNKDWYAYKENEPAAQAVVAESLRERRGVLFDPDDVFLTNGAFAALSVTLGTIVDPGDARPGQLEDCARGVAALLAEGDGALVFESSDSIAEIADEAAEYLTAHRGLLVAQATIERRLRELVGRDPEAPLAPNSLLVPRARALDLFHALVGPRIRRTVEDAPGPLGTLASGARPPFPL